MNTAQNNFKSLCVACGKPYVKLHHSRKYCSDECRNKTYYKIPLICKSCNKVFYVKSYRAKTSRYCSCKCWTTSPESKKIVSEKTKERAIIAPRIGKLSSNWQGGTTPELKSRLTCQSWRKLRKELLVLAEYKCKYCGQYADVIHHKISFRKGGKDTIDNLEVVCRKCHPVIERDYEFAEIIRMKCEDCSGKQDCQCPSCPIYPIMPYRVKTGMGIAAKKSGKSLQPPEAGVPAT